MTQTTQPCNFFNIYQFMFDDLVLDNTERLVFALIYSFHRGDTGIYFGTQSYLGRKCAISRRTVARKLKSLLEKGYIERVQGGNLEGYRVTKKALPKSKANNEDPEGTPFITIVDYIEEDEEEYEDVCEYTDEEKIDIRERLASCVKNPKYVFHSVSRDKIVQMTDEQYKKLLELVESDVLTAYIRKLELLIKNEGYRTFSPYQTIKRWILEDTKL